MNNNWKAHGITLSALLVLFFLGLACGSEEPAVQETTRPRQESAPRINAAAYYVKATGSNDNDGLTEQTPFKMLRKALREMETNRNIRTIIVLGTLDDYSEGTGSSNNPTVFPIVCKEGLTQITIKGKDDAAGDEKAVLMSTVAKGVVGVQGVNVRFENITITGGRGMAGGGIFVMPGSYRDKLQFAANGDIIKGSDRVHRFDASVTLGPGAVVSGNQAQNHGGGILLAMPDDDEAWEFKDSSLRIEGGVVEDNTAQGLGGGVYAASNAGFSMKDGAIRNNTAVQGGGIFVQFSASANAIDGGSITGNSAAGGSEENNGGGVVILGGTLTMNGGRIKENTAAVAGGGVAVGGYQTTFRLVNGEISDNRAEMYGGGILVMPNATASMRGGSLSGNSANDKGGGAAVASQGAFTLQGGSVTGNKSANLGGGVYVIRGGTFRLQGGQCAGNSASGGGDPDIYKE